MIKGHCFTNLDDYKRVDWPRVFVVVPREGDQVESMDRKKILKVCGITHCSKKEIDKYSPIDREEPYIEVELNK